ncbi:MAG: BatA domain-containing protein [Planctomycetota bacterium]
MDFINPSLLWLGLAGAVPIIIHLLNKRRYQRVRWAAMEFLLAAMKKTRKRIQLENLLLLLLRVLVVIGLVLALSRPFLTGKLAGGLAQSDMHIVIGLDNSYSMGYRPGARTNFEEAKEEANKLIDSLNSDRGDKVSLVTVSDRPEVVISEASMVLAQAKKKLADLELSDYGTDIAKFVPLVQDIITKSTSSRKSVYLITDNQRAGWEGLSGAKITELFNQISKSAEVHIIEVGEQYQPNLLVSKIYPSAAAPVSEGGIITVNMPVSFIVEVTNNSRNPVAQLKVNFLVNGIRQSTATVGIEPYKSTQTGFNYTFTAAGPNWIKAEIEADNLAIDDSRVYACDVREFIRVLLVDGEPTVDPFDDEVEFLRYVYYPSKHPVDDEPEFGRSRLTPYLVDVMSSSVFVTSEQVLFNKYDLVVVANQEFIPQDKVKSLEQWVGSGGGLMIFLGDKVDRLSYNEQLYKNGTGLLPALLSEVKGDKSHQQAVRMDNIDFNHPAIAFFDNIRDRLKSMLIYEYYATSGTDSGSSASARILARLNDSDATPLILEKSFGQGSTVLLTTSADTEWNMMPARQAYVVLIDQLSMNLVRAREQLISRNLQVGDTVRYSVRGEAGNLLMSTPKKGMVLLPAIAPAGQTGFGEVGSVINFPDTANSGLYTLEKMISSTSSKEKVSYFGVNPLPAESDLRRIGQDELKRIIGESVRVTGTGKNAAAAVNRSVAPPLSHLWKYLIYAVLAAAAMEMFLAYRFGRYK